MNRLPIPKLLSALQERKGWLFFAIFMLVVVGLFVQPYAHALYQWGPEAIWHGIYGSTMYSRVVISVNYIDDGFIRRGLAGTLAALISANDELGVAGYVLASIAFLTIPLALLVSHLAARAPLRNAGYLAGVLLLSPQTFIGWARDPVRTDVLAAGFIAWSVLAALAGRRWLAVLLVLGGLLVHEVGFIFGATLLLACFYGELRAGELARPAAARLLLGLVGGAALVLVLQFGLSPPATQLAADMVRDFPVAPHDRMWRDIAIYMAVGGSHALQTAMCHNFVLNPKWPITTVLCLGILASYAFILPLRKRPVLVIMAMLVPVFFMLVIANDVGRWLKLGVLNAWLLAAFLTLRFASFERFSGRYVLGGASMVAALLAMGYTPYNDINYATRHLIIGLGFEYKLTAEQWLNTCDPNWRSIVYGP